MPTYDYRCTSCSHELEVSQKITEDPLSLCPECKQPCLQRTIGGGNSRFQFKGSGFHVTDYCKTSGNCGCKGEKA